MCLITDILPVSTPFTRAIDIQISQLLNWLQNSRYIAEIKSVDNKKAAPFLTLPIRHPKVPLFKEKMHVHPRSRLNATPIFFF
jgi:hypothetical protein